MPKTILVVDIESTGLNPGLDDIVEIGIANLDLETGEVSKVFDEIIKPKRAIYEDAWVFRNTSLTPEEVRNARELDDHFRKLYSLFVNNVVVAYNVGFDVQFLRANGFDIPEVAIDPMGIATNILQIEHEYYGYKFPTFQECYHHYFGCDEYLEKHRAYDDAYHEAKVIYEMIKRGDYTLNN